MGYVTSEKLSLWPPLVERYKTSEGVEFRGFFVDFDAASVEPTLHRQAL
jgi:hypothetical protein